MKKRFLLIGLAAMLATGVGLQSCKNKTKETTTTTAPVTIDSPVTAPVVVNDDAAIKTSVDAVVKPYPNVTADVQNGKVTLRGTVNNRDEMQKIVMGVNEAHIKNFDNQITVKK